MNSPLPHIYTNLLETEEKKIVNLTEKDGQEIRIGSSQMTLKHMQRWSTSFKAREIQIKTIPATMLYLTDWQ